MLGPQQSFMAVEKKADTGMQDAIATPSRSIYMLASSLLYIQSNVPLEVPLSILRFYLKCVLMNHVSVSQVCISMSEDVPKFV